MDPKSPAQLDPKLQEAYNRVMGTPVTPPSSSTSPTTPTPSAPLSPTEPATPAAPTTPVMPAEPAIPGPVISTDPTPTQPAVTPAPTSPTITADTPAATSHAFVAKKGMKVSPVIMVVGGIAFLVVYTLIWVKVFNLQLPFMPSY